MSERKVLNKYFPPDFDPRAVPRTERPKNQQYKIRMMIPFTMRCDTCGGYLMAGKKMNSRSEVAHGFEYLGLRSYRFYMTCPNCHAEFTIRTDPKESDYVAESNCRRLYDPYKHEDENSVRKWLEGTDTSNEGPEAELRNLEQSKMDAMELLEQRTLQSKMEMEEMDKLDDLRAMNAVNARLNMDSLLKDHKERYEKLMNDIEEQDALLARQVFHNQIRRIEDEDEEENEEVDVNESEQASSNGIEDRSAKSRSDDGALHSAESMNRDRLLEKKRTSSSLVSQLDTRTSPGSVLAPEMKRPKMTPLVTVSTSSVRRVGASVVVQPKPTSLSPSVPTSSKPVSNALDALGGYGQGGNSSSAGSESEP